MRLIKFCSMSLALAATACVPLPAETEGGGIPAPKAEPRAVMVPAGAALGQDGYWTIGEVPPSPFPTTVPPDQSGESLVQQYARENGITVSEAQRLINGPPELHAELERIMPLIRSNEAGNFVDIRMVRDPAVVMEAWFKRDAAATLAKYTASPYFRPREGGLNEAEQKALRELWIGRIEGGAAISGMGVDPFTGQVDLTVGVSEAKFIALAGQRGWNLENVRATYAQEQPAAFADPSLASGVRVFAREVTDPQIRHQALGIGRIILDDGCFHLQPRGDETEASLVMFGYGSQLGRDEEGFLVVTNGTTRIRIGEIGGWSGPNGVDESNPDVIAQRRACGDGRIVNVAEPESYRHFGLPYPSWVTNYAKAKGITRQTAWDNVIACISKREKEGSVGIDARDRCIAQFN